MCVQSKAQSLAESLLNIAIGFVVSLVAQLAIFPLFGIYVPLASNLSIGLFFTGVSLVRGYAVRRFFNWVSHRQA